MLVPLVANELDAYHQPSVFSKVTLASFEQYWNAELPIVVTLSGITTLVILLTP